MPAVGRFIGTPASISASEEPQTVAIEDEPFELGDLGDDAHRVGELRRGRQHRVDRAPGELAVAEFAPLRRTHASGLADAEGGEVVMEQEALLVGALKRVDELLVLGGAERRNDQRLRFAAGEQGRAVGARQHADLAEDRANGRQVAAVDAAAVVEDVPAHYFRLRVMERLRDVFLGELGLALGGGERVEHLLLDRVDGGVALLLDGEAISGAQIRLADLQNRLLGGGLVGAGEFARLLGGLFGELDDRGDDRLESGVAVHDGFQHDLFRKLPGLGLDHQHRIGSAGDDEIERRVFQLLDRRVHDGLALDVADARGSDRSHERNAGKRERGRSGDDGQNVRVGFEVMAQHRDDDLRLAAEIVGEQRPDRPVDQAGDQNLLLRRLAFALPEAAGDAPRRVRLFQIVDGQGEEILPGLGGLGGDDRRQNRGFAPARKDGAVGLAGDAACFERKLAAAPIECFTLNIKHLSSSSVRMRKRAGFSLISPLSS